jgi:hypothetical protein
MVVRALKPPQNKSTRNRRSISWHHRRRPCSTSCVVCALLSSSALTMTRLRCGGDEFGHPRPCTHSAFRDGCSACAPALIDRECARARVLSRCEDNGADAARSRATCDGTVCCASPRGADGGGSAVGAPAPSQAAGNAMAPMRDPSRLETECVFAFPKGGARHRSRWCTGVMPPSSPEPPRPGIAAFPPVAYMPARLRVFRGLLRADGPTRVCLLLRLPCEEVRMPARLRGLRGVPRPPFARRVVCSLTREGQGSG